MKQKHFKIISLLLLTMAIMVKYQNCAPAKSLNSQNNFVPSDQVSVIDNIHKGTVLSFVDQEVQVSSLFLSTYLMGQCDPDQNGAIMSWNISRQLSGENEGSGTAKCVGGVFSVPVDIEAMECESVYQLRAEFGFDKGAETELKKRCPREIQNLVDQRMAQLGAFCFIEHNEENTCFKSCYQEGKLFLEERISCPN
ncbi:MAG: hypothetical protein SGJ18_13400 [Pseudomonadota bacterium]|nr:hypothetical protein [Pseudomonadota bacterium]